MHYISHFNIQPQNCISIIKCSCLWSFSPGPLQRNYARGPGVSRWGKIKKTLDAVLRIMSNFIIMGNILLKKLIPTDLKISQEVLGPARKWGTISDAEGLLESTILNIFRRL